MTDLLGPLKNIRAVQPEVDVPSEDPPCPPALGGLTLQEKDSLDDSDPIITPGAFKRLQAKQADQAELQRFLSKHRFQDVNSPKTFHCFQRGFALRGGTEELYPIHLAAKLGKPQLVKLLLREGVDRTKETSKGRSPLEVAQRVKEPRSRIQVIHVLQGTEMFIKQKWSCKDLLLMELNSTSSSSQVHRC